METDPEKYTDPHTERNYLENDWTLTYLNLTLNK